MFSYSKLQKKCHLGYSFNCYFSFCSFAQKNETFCSLYISFVLSPSPSSWFRFWMQVFTQVTRAHITAKDLPCIIAYKANLKPNAHTVPLRAIHHDLLLRSYFSLLAPFAHRQLLCMRHWSAISNQNHLQIKSSLVIVTSIDTLLRMFRRVKSSWEGHRTTNANHWNAFIEVFLWSDVPFFTLDLIRRWLQIVETNRFDWFW